MSRDQWPPGPRDDDARPKPGHAEPVAITPPNTRQSNPRQCCRNTVGRHADAWREGFAYGFRDALRLAAREIDDPNVWPVLARLAERNELAAGDS